MPQKELAYHIKKCRTFDPVSQKWIYRHFYNYTMTICSRYAQNREEAKEIMNDGFLKVFTKIDKYKDTLSFKAWINKIMVNTAIDHYRKNQRVPPTVDLVHAQFVEQGHGVLEELSLKDLLKLIQRLSPSYRMVFNLFIIEGFKHEEIAQRLGISVGTSKSNLAKARIKLKALLHSLDDKKSKYG